MAFLQPAARGPGISARAALLSIVGFWLFYFTIVTIRSAVLAFDNQLDLLGRRALVSALSVLITILMWLVLRRYPEERLGRRVLIAGLLAVPAAVLYSSANYYAFISSVPPQLIMRHAPSPPPPPPAPPVIVTQGVGDRRVTLRVDPSPTVSVQVGDDPAIDGISPLMAIADNAANGYFFFAAWAALFLALSYAADVGAAERRAAGFRAAAQAAELRALRYQVNPHFLFNTLNSLSSLIMTDRREAAEAMVMNLSTFFRTSLAGDPTEDVILADEIRLQQLYLEIEAVRFPERIRIAIDVPDALARACVPGLILQPLVENAVKYGVSRARRPVTVTIRASVEHERLRLRVEDDGDDLPGGEPGTGIGLRNVCERLAARFGADEARAVWGLRPGGGFAVTLLMPLVHEDCAR